MTSSTCYAAPQQDDDWYGIDLTRTSIAQPCQEPSVVATADMPGFFEATRQGDTVRAHAIVHRFEKLMAGLAGDRADGYNWAFGGMQPTLKAAMDILGQSGGYPRKPKLPIDDPAALADIRRILQDVGLDCAPATHSTGTDRAHQT
jgi:hypothetical protein